MTTDAIPQPANVGELFAHRIYQTNTKTLFALAGASYAPLLFTYASLPGTRIIGGRHESGTVGAADGYARRTGRVGFAIIVAEQALANALTAIYTAQQSNSPLVIIATRFPDVTVESRAEYVVDRHELTRGIKWSRTVPTAAKADEYFRSAISAATEGVPGPALLILPLDMITQPVPPMKNCSMPKSVVCKLPMAEQSQIDTAAGMIESGKKVIAVTDEGAAWGEATEGLQALAAMGVPVLGNELGRGLVPEAAPTGYPWPYAWPAAREADVVIVVGAQMTLWFGFRRAPRFGEQAKFIHIDRDAGHISRDGNEVDLPIVAHPGRTVAAIAAKLSGQGYTHNPSWMTEALLLRKERVGDFASDEGGAGKSLGVGIHQIEIGAALETLLPKDRIVVCDGADILNFTFGRLRLYTPRSYSDHLPYGAMGMGLPLAIGFAAGEAEDARDAGRAAAPTVYVTGDGSLGFFTAELDTARRAGLHMIMLVSNDSKWGTEYHGQNKEFGKVINTELGECDYSMIAKGFGCKGTTVKEREQLVPAIQEALAHQGPSLIDVLVDPMGGAIRKQDDLLGMIIFKEVAKNMSKKDS